MFASCHTCGKKVIAPANEPPCEALKGWFTVSHWQGAGTLSRYNFCSCNCLKTWVDNQSLPVPAAFLKSFSEDENQEGKKRR